MGDEPDNSLAPYGDYQEVERYRSYLKPADVTLMGEHFGVPEGNLELLASKLPEWCEAEGGFDEGGLFFWSTENPEAKFDWYQVGGRFAGYFRLQQPVPPSWWRRLLGKGPVDRVDRALKREVDAQAILAHPPADLLWNGVWHEGPISADEQELVQWQLRVEKLFAEVPEDALLTAVDLHS